MALQLSSVSVYKGRYHRTIGKVLNERGDLVPRKFLLGTDRLMAEIANHLLDKLWDEVVAEHEDALRFQRDLGGRLGDSNSITGEVDVQRLRKLDQGPVWRAESLLIAEAIRRGQREIVVQTGRDVENHAAYLERIAYLRRTYSVIAFIPASPPLYAAGQEALAADAKELVEQAQTITTIAQTPLPVAMGQTLHQAMDAYAQYAAKRDTRESSQREAAGAKRLKQSHPDIPLGQFGISSLERIAAYWASRPNAKNTRRPMALDSITDILKTARRFVRWLHRSEQFIWTKPVDAEDSLRVNVERLRTNAEIAALGRGVQVWTIEELAQLYRHATDQDRLFLLLGLNCGFAQAEIFSLRIDEIKLRPSPAITRIRRKNRVPGVFALWPETATAIDWFLRQRPTVSGPDSEIMMITKNGHPFDRQRIAIAWMRLIDRVQAAQPGFRRLSFKHLRKTAGQLVRDRSNGEIAGVFLCHGQAVATDDLADVYTNRPFDKVGATLAIVHRDLLPMFEGGRRGPEARRDRSDDGREPPDGVSVD
ncbi:MAG: tyrosine-type recombinase/integrase [Tepidisphaeraceae bacterium]